MSRRDGFRCLYAQRVNPATGAPIGDTLLVQHFHEARNISVGQSGVLSTGPGNAVRGGFFFYDQTVRRSNVWMLVPEPRR